MCLHIGISGELLKIPKCMQHYRLTKSQSLGWDTGIGMSGRSPGGCQHAGESENLGCARQCIGHCSHTGDSGNFKSGTSVHGVPECQKQMNVLCGAICFHPRPQIISAPPPNV